jgi:hypothetical protein
MQIALIQNNSVVTMGDSFVLFPNVSFPATGPTQEFLSENSAMEVKVWEPFEPSIEKLETVTPYIKDGKVYTCVKIPKTEVELQEDLMQMRLNKETEIRNQRTQLLRDSDWTQTKDSPDAVDVLWQPYRQLLRDITMQEGFPFNVVWPIAP